MSADRLDNVESSHAELATQHYLSNGYVIARNIIPQNQIDLVLSEVRRIFQQQLLYLGLAVGAEEGEDGLHRDMKTLLENDKDRYLASLRLCAKLLSIHDIFTIANVRAFARAIAIQLPVFQTAPVFHVMSDDLRVPGGYFGYGAHQDWPAMQSSLDAVTIWVPFVEVDENNYTMDVLPKSHVKGLYPGEMRQNEFEVAAQHYSDSDFLPIRAKPGDAVFMSCFLLHRSSTKGGKRVRLACSMRYENAAETSFVRNGYPSVHRRVVERQFIVKDLPQAREVQDLFRR
jgi:ectoine hydroxylase-related dioxygenase (phytanoyl-CoA dioxygenase family)